MSKFDFKTQREISILASFLSAIDEEVISEKDLLSIKDKNINNESDLRYVSDIILKPWFLEYTKANRYNVIQSIDFVINNQDNLINEVFSEVNFIFHYEIENKVFFLKKIKTYLEEYMQDSE
ncbi:hypothetical protein [Serratia fonticola]|uniref:hypothetical protein n=1 Tax=Serratia fonticola TaxID=47917 RepID=UPI00192CD1B6|nr:hypothetical protein [Serratia fonticola]MBL5864214.1 hypothetical protein [Serratia fonticola]CAI0997955.1 Uncharacterised protein [Serratia fonticola]CAI1191739.1 Uncharacterised protein [Serratia fonticola]CAI1964264.1 Uncharacterised protein [Serratia fonticola]